MKILYGLEFSFVHPSGDWVYLMNARGGQAISIVIGKTTVMRGTGTIDV